MIMFSLSFVQGSKSAEGGKSKRIWTRGGLLKFVRDQINAPLLTLKYSVTASFCTAANNSLITVNVR